MTAGGESADASDLPGEEVVDFGGEPAEVSPTLVNATAGEQVVSALSSGPMTHLDGASSGPRRALVLGGGGVLGFAWIVGALSALQVEAGFDARDVQLVVGTSAGAVAAVHGLLPEISATVIRMALTKSMKNAPTSGTTRYALGAGP